MTYPNFGLVAASLAPAPKKSRPAIPNVQKNTFMVFSSFFAPSFLLKNHLVSRLIGLLTARGRVGLRKIW
jgi:hypothetical protein